jgi:hypothetical protein
MSVVFLFACESCIIACAKVGVEIGIKYDYCQSNEVNGHVP